MNTLKISINKITESLVIFKKIGKCNCMRFFFFVGYISFYMQIANDTVTQATDVQIHVLLRVCLAIYKCNVTSDSQAMGKFPAYEGILKRY